MFRNLMRWHWEHEWKEVMNNWPGSYWSTWIDRVLLMMPETPDRLPRVMLCFLLIEEIREAEMWTFTGTKGLCNSFSRYSFTLELSPSGSPSSGFPRKDREDTQEVDKKSSNRPKATRVPLMYPDLSFFNVDNTDWGMRSCSVHVRRNIVMKLLTLMSNRHLSTCF